MKRVIVIGSGGSGKSTFSRRLGERTKIPVVHLDQLYWLPGWTKRPQDEWLAMLNAELQKDEWIMDGNFGATREMRMLAADTIVMLDVPRWRCMYRILKRVVTYRSGSRPDMAEGCDERFDPEFILWVWNYPKQGRKRAMNEIARFTDKRVVMLRTRKEIERFLMEADAS